MDFFLNRNEWDDLEVVLLSFESIWFGVVGFFSWLEGEVGEKLESCDRGLRVMNCVLFIFLVILFILRFFNVFFFLKKVVFLFLMNFKVNLFFFLIFRSLKIVGVFIMMVGVVLFGYVLVFLLVGFVCFLYNVGILVLFDVLLVVVDWVLFIVLSLFNVRNESVFVIFLIFVFDLFLGDFYIMLLMR